MHTDEFTVVSHWRFPEDRGFPVLVLLHRPSGEILVGSGVYHNTRYFFHLRERMIKEFLKRKGIKYNAKHITLLQHLKRKVWSLFNML